MLDYYFAVILITIMLMVVSLLQLSENKTFSRKIKENYITIAIFIILGAFCEFCNVRYDTYPGGSKTIHGIIKAIELSVAPIIPILYVRIIDHPKNDKIPKLISNILILCNIAFQVSSIFVPFIFYIDDTNVYNHGKYYYIYIVIYITNIFIFIIELLQYTKRYQMRNLKSLIAILCFLFLGLSIHWVNSDIRTDWLVVGIIFTMFLVYYSDLSLKVDALTDLLNRNSYQFILKKLDYRSIIIIFDCNNFKEVNDTYGHLIGDDVLKIIAKEIMNVYSKYGYCYRIGGDEFAVIFKQGVIDNIGNISNFVEGLNSKFNSLIEEYDQERYPLQNGVSIGWSVFEGIYGVNSRDENYIDSLVKGTLKNADQNMYQNKQDNK